MGAGESSENFLLKFAKQSSHYFSGYALMMLGGFISFPILTRIFSKGGYGIISLVSITVWILLAFTKVGMQESAVRFYNEFNTGKRKDSLSVFYTTLYFGSLGFALIIALLAGIAAQLLFKDLMPSEMQNLIWIIVFMVISGSMYLRLTNFLRAEQHTKALNIALVAHRYTSLGLALIFILLIGKTISLYYSGIIITDVLVITSLTIIYVKQKKIIPANFSFSFLKECLVFGSPFIGYELANYLIKSTDRYLIQIFLGVESVGLYSAASNLCIYIKDGVLFPVIYAITPIYMELWETKGEEATGEFISQIINYLLLIIIPVIFGFSVLGKQIIILLASAKFEESAQVIPYIVSGTLFWGLSPLLAAGLYIKKQTKKLTMIVFIGVGINTALNIVFIPRIQLIGAAVATLITYTVLLGLLLKISSKYLAINFNIRSTLTYCFGGTIMYLVVRQLDFQVSFSYLFFEIAIGVLVYICIVLLIDNNSRKLAFKLVKRKKIF